MKIHNLKQMEVDKFNFERRREVTHNTEEFIELKIPQEFIDDIKNFQRVVQYQFENTMRDVFIATLDAAKEQLKFAIKEIEESTGIPILQDESEFSTQDIKQVLQISRSNDGEDIDRELPFNELNLSDQ